MHGMSWVTWLVGLDEELLLSSGSSAELWETVTQE